MAINKVIYNGETLIDLSDASVTPETLLSGATAYNAAGEKITGTATAGTSGGGSGGGVLSGEFTFDVNTLTTTVEIGQTYTHFAIFAYNKVNTSSGKGTLLCAVDKSRGFAYGAGTNNAGSSLTVALYSEAPTVTEESSKWTFGSSSVVAYEQSVTITGHTSGTCLSYFLAGVTYRWYAWTEGASGGVELPELTNPAAAEQIVEGYEAINAEGEVVTGSNPYEKTATDAEVNTQTDLIEQLRTVLQNKSAGDTSVEDGLLTKTLTEYSNGRLTSLGLHAFSYSYSLTSISLPLVTAISNNCFYNCTALADVDLPLATSISTYAFAACSKLEKVVFPAVKTVGTFVFYNCTSLKVADFSTKVTINGQAFGGCSALEALILRSAELCPMGASNAVINSGIAKGTGYAYVPAALVDSYKAATNWSTYADQIRALEDYTVDGTTTGELDETKIAEVTEE